jgi:hypothetical protein
VLFKALYHVSKELITPFGTSVKSKKGGFGGKNKKF